MDTSEPVTATKAALPPPADPIDGKSAGAAIDQSGVGALAKPDSPSNSGPAARNEFPLSAGPAEAALGRSEARVQASESSAARTENPMVTPAPSDGSAKDIDASAAGLGKSASPGLQGESSAAKDEHAAAKSETANATVEAAESSSKTAAAATGSGSAGGSSQTDSAQGEGAMPNSRGAPDPGNEATKTDQPQSAISVAHADPAAGLQPANAKTSESSIALAPEVRAELLNVGRRVVSFAFPIEIGERVPEDINLGVVPAAVVEQAPALSGRFFFVVGDRVVVADPQTRQIVEIIGPNG
jgi:hypothetical protein